MTTTRQAGSPLSRSPRQPARSHILRRVLASWRLYVLLALPLIYLAVFKYYPMYGAQIAFRQFTPAKGIWGSAWVGWQYVNQFIHSPQFVKVLWNTLRISLYSLAVGFPLSIAFAIMINSLDNLRFKKVTQMVTYAPHFISEVVMVGMLIMFLSPRSGIINKFVELLGGRGQNFMGMPGWFDTIYVFSGQWQHLGWNAIIYIAALASIDPSQHEAAIVDGASKLERVWYVDLPGILPTTITMLLLNAGQLLNVGFEKVYLMQNNLNLGASEIISTFQYKQALSTVVPNYSYATAIGLFNSVVNLIVILLLNRVAKSASGVSLW